MNPNEDIPETEKITMKAGATIFSSSVSPNEIWKLECPDCKKSFIFYFINISKVKHLQCEHCGCIIGNISEV